MLREILLCFLPGLLVLTSGKCCISFQTKTFKVLYEMLTSRQRFESQVLEMSSPLLEPSSGVCLYKLDLICTWGYKVSVWLNSSWYETQYWEKEESILPSEHSSQQEARYFPCLSVTSSCEAIVRIASVFIGKYFQVEIHMAFTNSLKLVGNPQNIWDLNRPEHSAFQGQRKK